MGLIIDLVAWMLSGVAAKHYENKEDRKEQRKIEREYSNEKRQEEIERKRLIKEEEIKRQQEVNQKELQKIYRREKFEQNLKTTEHHVNKLSENTALKKIIRDCLKDYWQPFRLGIETSIIPIYDFDDFDPEAFNVLNSDSDYGKFIKNFTPEVIQSYRKHRIFTSLNSVFETEQEYNIDIIKKLYFYCVKNKLISMDNIVYRSAFMFEVYKVWIKKAVKYFLDGCKEYDINKDFDETYVIKLLNKKRLDIKQITSCLWAIKVTKRKYNVLSQAVYDECEKQIDEVLANNPSYLSKKFKESIKNE